MKAAVVVLILIISIISTSQSAGQSPSIQWQKCLGGTQGDGGVAIKQTQDGGYLVCAGTSSNDGDVSGNHFVNYSDYWVVKLDSIGYIQWQKCFGGSSEDWASSLQLTSDGGFIIAGSSNSTDGDVVGVHGDADFWIVKCDSLGVIQWQKCVGGTDQEMAYQIINNYDGGYVVIGEAVSRNYDCVGRHYDPLCSSCADVFIVKLDSLGGKQWSKCYGGIWGDSGRSIAASQDSGYTFVSLTRSDDGDVQGLHGSAGINADFWITNIDSAGIIQWQKCLGGLSEDVPSDFIKTFDGGYLLTGYTSSFDFDANGIHGLEDVGVIKLDSITNIQWQKCYGGTEDDIGKSIIQISDSEFIMIAFTNSNDGDVSGNHSSLADMWLVKLDENGIIEWQKCLGGSDIEQALDIQQTFDGGLILTGNAASSDGDVNGLHGNGDVWIVKLSPLNTSVISPDYITDFAIHSKNELIDLTFFSVANQYLNVELFDIAGRRILQETLVSVQGFNKHTVRTGRLSKGIYLVRLVTKGGSVTKKLVVG